ncbi:MAG TPA: tRNA (adenosine(37)-N6)-dimethylallyltransferase MiaA, partial [candidate division Zixibacteria bacterium]|nr:tRNA (adenosine(37)-N6)-dimethylallyltransferase MiaA [candidate division Zixibacteria bacterium]
AVFPTAVGIEIAGRIGGEIISADARQVYAGMPIGTCAPIDEAIPHHLVGYLSPAERTTAFAWAKLAAEHLDDIYRRGKSAIIVGGTGLYIDALTEGIFEAPASDAAIRDSLYARAENAEDLHAQLAEIDPTSADRIHPNNLVRVIRALEVYYTSGKSLTENFEATAVPAEGWKFAKFFLDMDREALYARIEERTRALLSAGWIDEVRRLVLSGNSEDSPGMNAIGYREILRYLRGEITSEELAEEIARKTRNYAKRQITWFSNRGNFQRIDITNTPPADCAESIISEVIDFSR